jgi:hypothetical protein
MLFDIYVKEIEVEGEKYTIRPLTGRYIGKLYGCIGKLGVKEGMSEQEAAESMNPEAMADLYEIALETFKASYPKEDENKLAGWVTQNLTKLIQPIIEVNINTKAQK